MQVVQNGGFDNFSFESLLFSVVQGGISAGMAGTIGDGLMASKLTGFTKLAAGIALHALSGGLQATVFGGNVWQGAISGAVGHLVGEELNSGASKLLGRATDDLGLLGYFVTGGGTSAAVAYATGGDPMQAFIIGGATAAFNSFMHGKPKKAAWDLNGDGHLQKEEADAWYRGASGLPITVNVSEVDIKMSDLIDDSRWNEKAGTKAIQTLFRKNGKIYGNITLHKVGRNTYEILPDEYNFERHGDHWYSSPVRNPATNYGSWVASDYGSDTTTRSFMIHFKGTLKITTNAPKWRFF